MGVIMGDLNKLRKLCDFAGMSININYCEVEGSLELETISAAPIEILYMKRCYDVDYFIEKWFEQVNPPTDFRLAWMQFQDRSDTLSPLKGQAVSDEMIGEKKKQMIFVVCPPAYFEAEVETLLGGDIVSSYNKSEGRINTPTKTFQRVQHSDRMRGYHGAQVHFGYGAEGLADYDNIRDYAPIVRMP